MSLRLLLKAQPVSACYLSTGGPLHLQDVGSIPTLLALSAGSGQQTAPGGSSKAERANIRTDGPSSNAVVTRCARQTLAAQVYNTCMRLHPEPGGTAIPLGFA